MLERKKARSAVLAALVIVSVAITAVPVSAAVDSGERSAPDSMSAGGTTTVTVTATMDSDGGAFSMTDEFSGNIAGASIQSVTVDGSSVSPMIASANTNTALVTLANTGPNAQIEVTYEITATNERGEITIDGKVDGDNTISLGTDTITVGEDNSPPTAEAGENRSAVAGETITLDGSASTDPDGDSLTYTWRRVSGPAVVDQGSGGPTTTAELRESGTAVFRLDVSDGLASDSDTVTVEVSEGSTSTTTTTTTSDSTGDDTTTESTTTSTTTESMGDDTTTEPTTTSTTTESMGSETTTESMGDDTTTESTTTSTTTESMGGETTTESMGDGTTTESTGAGNTTTTTSSNTTTSGDGPGFTVVVALAALVAAALVAVRRDR